MVGASIIVLLVLVAFTISLVVYPFTLKFAVKHELYDNPNMRKLQRRPVPAMGGVTVYIGVLIASVIAFWIFKDIRFVWVLSLLFIMLVIGVWDDIKSVSPYLRFGMEAVLVWSIILLMHVEIDDFHGLWGIYKISEELSVFISLIAGIGIINAINLIDGVDGYCSLFSIMAFSVFGAVFFKSGDAAMGTICFIAVGALIPFFIHNVFGWTSKMFLGDGGSLVMGTLLTICLFSMLSCRSQCVQLDWSGISLVALSLAIFAVPVVDTLRVMIARVMKYKSPFMPDKTHFHHLFVDMMFSHAGTSIIIVTGNFLIVLFELLLWKCGVSVDWQVYLVAAVSILYTCVFYYVMVAEGRKNDGKGSRLYGWFCRMGQKTHLNKTLFWASMRMISDHLLLGENYLKVADYVRSSKKRRPDPRIR